MPKNIQKFRKEAARHKMFDSEIFQLYVSLRMRDYNAEAALEQCRTRWNEKKASKLKIS